MKKYFKKLSIFLVIAAMVIPALMLTACSSAPVDPVVESIEMYGKPTKTEYFVDDIINLDADGYHIKVIYNVGDPDILIVQKTWVENFDILTATPGTKTLKITYEGKFCNTAKIDVKAYVPPEPVEVESGEYKIKSISILNELFDFDGESTDINEYVAKLVTAYAVNELNNDEELKRNYANDFLYDVSGNNDGLRKGLINEVVAEFLADELMEASFSGVFGSDESKLAGIIKDFLNTKDFEAALEAFLGGNTNAFNFITSDTGAGLAATLANVPEYKDTLSVSGCLDFLGTISYQDIDYVETIITIAIEDENTYEEIIATYVLKNSENLAAEFLSILTYLDISIFAEDNTLLVGDDIEMTFTTDHLGNVTLSYSGELRWMDGAIIKYNPADCTFTITLAYDEEIELDIIVVYQKFIEAPEGN